MKKCAVTLLLMIVTTTLFAFTNPTVILKTASLGYVYTQPFVVNVTFSEPVTAFGPTQVNITNGTVTNVSGSPCQPNFVMTIKPIAPGPIKMFIPENSVTSVDTNLPNQASNTLTITALDPALRPSSNFDLRQWILTLPIPIGKRDNAISIGQVTLNGNPSLNTGYSNAPYFNTDPATGAMNFLVPLNGATTPNSNYARTELYEILPGISPTWKLSTFASNTLTASVSITHVPPIEKRFVIGQIHDKGDTDVFGNSASNSPLLKLYYDANTVDPNGAACNGCVYGQVRTTPSQANFLKVVNLIKDIPLNSIFIYKITLLRDGTLTIKANDKSVAIKLNSTANNTLGWGAQSLYFKAGAYNLEHDSVKGGASSFYSLQVTHS